MNEFISFLFDDTIKLALDPLLTSLVVQAALSGLSNVFAKEPKRVPGSRSSRGFIQQNPTFLQGAFGAAAQAAPLVGQQIAGKQAANLAFQRQQGLAEVAFGRQKEIQNIGAQSKIDLEKLKFDAGKALNELKIRDLRSSIELGTEKLERLRNSLPPKDVTRLDLLAKRKKQLVDIEIKRIGEGLEPSEGFDKNRKLITDEEDSIFSKLSKVPKGRVINTSTQSAIDEFSDLTFEQVNNPAFLKELKKRDIDFNKREFLDAFRKQSGFKLPPEVLRLLGR